MCRHVNKRERAQLRNYLLSMYEHVKELAYTVAECECKSTGKILMMDALQYLEETYSE